MTTFISRPLDPRTDPPSLGILWLEGCGDLDNFRLYLYLYLLTYSMEQSPS